VIVGAILGRPIGFPLLVPLALARAIPAAMRSWMYRDHGISGGKGREKRPAFDKLHRDATLRKFDLVMAWSVDRLGRSLQDLVHFLDHLRSTRVELFLHQQGLDTTSPAGRAMFGMLSVFSEFERAIKNRIRAAHQAGGASLRDLAAQFRVGRETVKLLPARRPHTNQPSDLDDHVTKAIGRGPQLPLLVLGRLVGSADPQIQRGAHGKFSCFTFLYIGLLGPKSPRLGTHNMWVPSY
jgi:hypothetical protein